MRKTLISCCAISILFLSGCVKRYFTYTVNTNLSGTWHIDQTGAFPIIATQLSSTLDVPTDADIIEANIESLTLIPRIKPGHTATSVQAEGRLNGRTLFPRQNVPFEIGGVPIEFVPQGLIDAAVAELRQLLNDFAKNKRFPAGTTMSLNGAVQGGRALLDIEYSIRATVKYGRCEEILEVMGDVAKPCP